MWYSLLADMVVILHLFFVLFVIFGGLLCYFQIRWAWLHLPSLAWGSLMEFTGWICPLTPLENSFRHLAGNHGYPGSFIDHYLKTWLYPPGLTPNIQWLLGILLILFNLAVYALILCKKER